MKICLHTSISVFRDKKNTKWVLQIDEQGYKWIFPEHPAFDILVSASEKPLIFEEALDKFETDLISLKKYQKWKLIELKEVVGGPSHASKIFLESFLKNHKIINKFFQQRKYKPFYIDSFYFFNREEVEKKIFEDSESIILFSCEYQRIIISPVLTRENWGKFTSSIDFFNGNYFVEVKKGIENSQAKDKIFSEKEMNQIVNFLKNINESVFNIDCGVFSNSSFSKFITEYALEDFSLLKFDLLGRNEAGGSRTFSARESYQKLKMDFCFPFGIIPKIKEFDSESIFLCELNTLVPSGDRLRRFNSSGKGIDSSQSLMSGIGEMLERHHLYRVSNFEKFYKNSIRAESKETPWGNYFGYSEKQLISREEKNKELMLGDPGFILDKVSIDSEIHWLDAFNLKTRKKERIPAQACYFPFADPRLVKDKLLFACSSNGLASGRSKIEALIQGLCEIVERDQVGIWWHGKISLPGIDVSSFENKKLNTFLSSYKNEKKRNVFVLDLTMDLNIPTVATISYNPRNKSQLSYGFGSHYSIEMAIERSLTEMAQLDRYYSQYWDGKKPKHEDFKKFLDIDLENCPFLKPIDNSFKLKSDYSDNILNHEYSMNERFDDLINNLLVKGINLYVKDYPKLNESIETMRVFAPELNNHMQRFKVKRLYDVLKNCFNKDIKESELNQISLYI